MVEVTDRENRKTLLIPVDQEELLSVSVLKQYFPGTVGLVYLGEDGKETAVLFDESMKKLLPPADGWNKIFYIFRPSISAGAFLTMSRLLLPWPGYTAPLPRTFARPPCTLKEVR
uniref:TAR DNA-binding protein 43 N-terminal domain-containing protein n=1 Tax=Acrobeloides nanus TaxID=290746 RepID=A0A914CJ50_9BILA